MDDEKNYDQEDTVMVEPPAFFSDESDAARNEPIPNRPEPAPPRPRVRGYALLWVLVIVSFALNALLLGGLFDFRQQARQEVERVRDSLSDAKFEDLTWDVEINQVLPVSITVPFSDTFQVPVSMTIPVSTSVLFTDVIEVPINTVLPINIRDIGGAGLPTINLEFIPLSTVVNVPVNLMVSVPISREIPVETDIPVALMLEVPVSTTVPIQMDIPVILDIPVTVPLDEIGFQTLLAQLQDALDSLAEILGAPPAVDLPQTEP